MCCTKAKREMESKVSDKGATMDRRKIRSRILLTVAALTFLTGCTGEIASTEKHKEEIHEAITMQSPFRNMSAFIEMVHEQYPEINIEVVPYSGANYTAYVKAQLAANDMPDIYCSTYYIPGREDVSDRLIDMSGYAFTDNYAEARLREVRSICFLLIMTALELPITRRCLRNTAGNCRCPFGNWRNLRRK